MATNNNRMAPPITCLLLSSSLVLTACSSNPSVWSSAEGQPEPVQEAVVAEPVETAPVVEVVDAQPQALAAETAPEATHDIRVRADYPREYVVKKGDTLWGIASQFLEDPWYWPEIWYRNPQVQNPHLIYPGDKLALTYVNGRPTMQVVRTEEPVVTAGEEKAVRTETGTATDDGRKVVRLSPSIHRTDRDIAIASIPSDAIKQFLTNPRVITRHELDKAPYIVASDDAHLILGTDNLVYVRDIYKQLDPDKVRYSVYRRGEEFRDPDTDDILGYEIVYAGEARIDRHGNPATATLINTKREVLVGDFLLDTDKNEFSHMYFPKVPEQKVDARVISLFDAISSSAKYQIVVINKGEKQGIQVGHVLATYFRGGEARDKYLARKKLPRGQEAKLDVQLPDERSGLMMIFKVFDDVSYGLILESKRVIRRNDAARNPQ